MRRTLLSLIIVTLMVIGLKGNLKAQTAGTLTFTYNQAAPSGQATKNVMAVWIEDSTTGAFVKTKMRYWSGGTSDHLPSWVANSGQSVVDASTGATLTSGTSPTAFGTKTITWDGTNTSTTLVADKPYNIFIESSYCNPQPNNGTHWLITNFTFFKGPNAQHLRPNGPANFSGIKIDWVPTTSPLLTTETNTNVSLNSATCSGNITTDGGSALIERGICYDTLPNPSPNKNHVVCSTTSTGAFTCNLTGLLSNKTYYYKAYAKNSITLNYGVDSTFKTTCVKPTTPVATANGNILTSNATSGNQWCKTMSGAIGGATNQTYNPTVNGTYYVTVTVSGCTSDSSNNIQYVGAGVETLYDSKLIKVYPNPVSNELVIVIAGNTTKQNFEIYNSIGQIVFSGNIIEKTTVKTTDFAAGVYMIKLENGKSFEFKKIVKE